MNILIVALSDAVGGTEQYLKMIAKEFIPQGYNIYIFFLTKRNTKLWEDIKSKEANLIYTNSSKEKYGLFTLIRNILNKRHITFDYAFSSHVYTSSLLGVLRRLRLIRINHFLARESTSVFNRFSGLKLLRFNVLYHVGYLSIDLLVCQTEYMKKQLLYNLPYLKNKIKIEVIPNPIDNNDMALKSNEMIYLNYKDSYIVSAGRLIPEKGFDILITAFARIKKEYKELKLIILGEGKLKESLRQLIKELQLEDDINLVGFVENVYPYFRQAKMCVVSSRIEGFPNVLLQMMSQNEKVVSTLCAGDIDQIKGLYTCKPDNESSLAEAMMSCLGSDTTENRKLFDKELEERSIDKFIEKINFYLEH